MRARKKTLSKMDQLRALIKAQPNITMEQALKKVPCANSMYYTARKQVQEEKGEVGEAGSDWNDMKGYGEKIPSANGNGKPHIPQSLATSVLNATRKMKEILDLVSAGVAKDIIDMLEE